MQNSKGYMIVVLQFHFDQVLVEIFNSEVKVPLTVSATVQLGMGCVIILSAVPVYFLCIYWRDKPTLFKQGTSNITVLSYFIFHYY